MDAVTTQLMHDGVKAFADSFDELIENISAKRERLLIASAAPAGVSLGKARATADEAVASLQGSDAIARIWSKDHTLWSDDPTEIADRLGWLDMASSMLRQVDDLTAFADEVRHDGIEHVVLLGMGGSSLGPEVLGQCLGSREGFPELIVLDSTLPSRIRTVLRRPSTRRAPSSSSHPSPAPPSSRTCSTSSSEDSVEDAVDPADAGNQLRRRYRPRHPA